MKTISGGNHPVVESEQDIFKAINIPYVKPQYRIFYSPN